MLLSCAISADGCLDDASPTRLNLSSEADWDRVDGLRAGCDAILVGAGTVRDDDPRLLIRNPARRAARAARGLPPDPVRVTLTASGDLPADARIFAARGGPALVYCGSPAAPALAARLGERAVVIAAGDPLSVRFVVNDLAERGICRLLVEGGSRVLRSVLEADLADELHLAVAPFFVGDADAPRFGLPGGYPRTPDDPMTLASVSRLGAMAVSRYLLGPGGADRRYLSLAVELARLCPPSRTAFSVGAVIVGADGEILSTGYSREDQDHDHAEEVALRRLRATSPSPDVPPADPDPRLHGATLYSSLVPCGARASRPVTCVRHIVAAGIPRVVFAWREPSLFTAGEGGDQLRAAGVEVVELPDLAGRAAAVNAHLLS